LALLRRLQTHEDEKRANGITEDVENAQRPILDVLSDYVISEFVTYYNQHRAHSEREHLPPVRSAEPETIETLQLDDVVVTSYVGGMVKSFERKAA